MATTTKRKSTARKPAARKPTPRKGGGINWEALAQSDLFWIIFASGVFGTGAVFVTIYRNQTNLTREIAILAAINGVAIFILVLSLAVFGKLVPHLSWLWRPLIFALEVILNRDLSRDGLVGNPRKRAKPVQIPEPEIIEAQFVDSDPPIKELGLNIPGSKVRNAFQAILQTRVISRRGLYVHLSQYDADQLFSKMETMGLIAPKDARNRTQGFVVVPKGFVFMQKVLNRTN